MGHGQGQVVVPDFGTGKIHAVPDNDPARPFYPPDRTVTGATFKVTDQTAETTSNDCTTDVFGSCSYTLGNAHSEDVVTVHQSKAAKGFGMAADTAPGAPTCVGGQCNYPVLTIKQPTPRINDDAASTPQNQPLSIDVLANDVWFGSDSSDALTITDAVTQPAHGSVTLVPVPGCTAAKCQTITYTPTAGFVGSDSFTYTAGGDGGSATATVTVKVTDVPPTIRPDAAQTTGEQPVTIPVLSNDSAAAGNALSLTSVGSPEHGTAVANPDGTITYRARPGFSGSDSFTYTASDGKGGSGSATVMVNVAAVPAVQLPAVQRPRHARLVISHRRVRLNNGNAEITLRCVGSEGSSCDGSLALKPTGFATRLKARVTRKAGGVQFSIPAGQSHVVRIPVPGGSRKRLTRDGKAVALTLVTLTSSGASLANERAITLIRR